MIVCHRHRFIFIKTRKTAGTSIEIALSKFCGEEDIIARISPADEALRAERGYRGPQNDLLPFAHYTPNDWVRLATRGRRARLRSHMRAARLRAALGNEVWDSYFKFCVERDPWDKAISLYYWRTRELDPRPPLLSFLSDVGNRSLSNFDIYAIDGTLAMDRVIRFERLTEDLEDVRNLLELPERLDLPSANGWHHEKQRHYSELLGAPERGIVDAACAREIDLFDYGFRSIGERRDALQP